MKEFDNVEVDLKTISDLQIEKVEFYIETPIIPNSAVCYPSRDNIEYGITVSYVSEGK